MENKYYPPELSEFCVGFEYQRYMERDFDEGSCIWEDKIFPEEGLCTGTIEHPNIVEIFYENYLEGVRVKYLDQQDIEDCGFRRIYWHHKQFKKYVNTSSNEDMWYLIWVFKDKDITIEKVEVTKKLTHRVTKLFRGTIKNKTEFKKLLKMLGI